MMTGLFSARRFVEDRSGNFLVVIAVATIPLMLLMGVVIDIGVAYTKKSKIQGAADAAVLAGLSEAKVAFSTMTGNQFINHIENTMQEFFEANAGDDLSALNLNPVFDVTLNNATATTRVEFDGQTEVIVDLFGMQHIDIAGTSAATASLLVDIDLHLLVDSSASMGIGADLSDQQIIFNEVGCAISCHVDNRGTYDDAIAAGAVTRIDVARDALDQAMQSVPQDPQNPDQIRVGQYRFSNWLTPVFEVDHPNSANLNWVRNELDSGVMLEASGGGTNLRHALDTLEPRLNSLIAANTETRRQFVFIITDGIEDPLTITTGTFEMDPNYTLYAPYLTTSYNRHRIQNVNPQMCQSLKDQGIEIAIVYTPYIVPPTSLWNADTSETLRFEFVRDVLLNDSETLMRQCASDPSYFYVANDSDEIEAAIQQFFNQVVVPPHIIE